MMEAELKQRKVFEGADKGTEWAGTAVDGVGRKCCGWSGQEGATANEHSWKRQENQFFSSSLQKEHSPANSF